MPTRDRFSLRDHVGEAIARDTGRQAISPPAEGKVTNNIMCHVTVAEATDMSDKPNSAILEIYLHEFDKLKDEAIARIGFRDNMLYITLATVGAVASFAVSNPEHNYALLIIPWVCVVLGWTYLSNDEKVSAISTYFRDDLEPRVRIASGTSAEQVFGWEWAYRNDPGRMSRKQIHFVVDQIAFVLSGLSALGAFLMSTWPVSIWTLALVGAEAALLGLLGVQFYWRRDFVKISV
jgi:hypothetical protein